jgi:hypothetical protein
MRLVMVPQAFRNIAPLLRPMSLLVMRYRRRLGLRGSRNFVFARNN